MLFASRRQTFAEASLRSSLDIFGGTLVRFEDLVKYNNGGESNT